MEQIEKKTEDVLEVPKGLWEAANDVILQAAHVHRILAQPLPARERDMILRLQDAGISLGFELMQFQRIRYDSVVQPARLTEPIAYALHPKPGPFASIMGKAPIPSSLKAVLEPTGEPIQTGPLDHRILPEERIGPTLPPYCHACAKPIRGSSVDHNAGDSRDGIYHVLCWQALNTEADLHAKE